MNAIMNLSWHRAKISYPSPSISEALACCESVAPKGAVLHYREVGRTVLVFHKYLKRVVEVGGLNPGDNFIWTGLLDMLGRGQAMVHLSVPALTVTKLAGLAGLQVVFAVDDNRIPRGLFFPSSVRRRLPQIEQQIADYFSLEEMIMRLDSVRPDFHSEHINHEEHDVLWCEGGHVTENCPCPEPPHTGLGCGPAGIDS